jgi:glutamine amidotransferase
MIAVVDYRAGNLTSVKRALDYLGMPGQITAEPEVVRRAERIIFPGVGHAASAMQSLREQDLDLALKEAFAGGAPILGICLGAQIILDHSEEGETPGLGIIPGVCRRFRLDDPSLKVPHIGWNAVALDRAHPVLDGVHTGDEFYFVHSYYPQPAEPRHVYARCEYGIAFPAAIGCQNLLAVQFHPEKSGPAGLRLLESFGRWRP